MKFIRTKIQEVILIQPDVYGDSRGFFLENYSKKLFRANGIDVDFVQDNHSRSARGVLRGIHYQIAPHAQAKLVRVVRGEAFDVVVDIRKNSKSFGRYVSHLLSETNNKMVFVPAGFAHGFCALADGTEFLYKVSDDYSPLHERGLMWNDPTVGIEWPKVEGGYILSEKDKRHPGLKEI